MAAVNQVGNALTGSSGSGSFAGTTSPSFTTPTLGAASATSVAFSSTSGIIGTTTNDNAAAGSVGEVISSTVLIGAAISVTTSTPVAVTTISLTAGDWDVWGTVWSSPAAGTITTMFAAGINSVNSIPGAPSTGTSYATLNFTSLASVDNQLPTGPCRISVAGTTTIYLFTYIVFSVSTMGAYGQLTARRRR